MSEGTPTRLNFSLRCVHTCHFSSKTHFTSTWVTAQVWIPTWRWKKSSTSTRPFVLILQILPSLAWIADQMSPITKKISNFYSRNVQVEASRLFRRLRHRVTLLWSLNGSLNWLWALISPYSIYHTRKPFPRWRLFGAHSSHGFTPRLSIWVRTQPPKFSYSPQASSSGSSLGAGTFS